MTTRHLINALWVAAAAFPLTLAGQAYAQPDVLTDEADTEVDGLEDGADEQGLPRLTLNQMQMGTFEEGDITTPEGHYIDPYEMELEADKNYRVEIAGQGFVALIYVVDAEGNPVDGLVFEADETGVTFRVPRAGVYGVGTMTRDPGTTGMYMVGFGESERAPQPVAGQTFPVNIPADGDANAPQDQPDNNSGQVVDINIPNDAQEISATLDREDIVTDEGKFFAFISMELQQGQTYHFHIASDGFPVMLNMQDNDGNFVQINGVGLNGRYINVTPPADGNYSLLIVGLEPGQGGNYTISAWQAEPAFAPGSNNNRNDRDTDGPNHPPADPIVDLNEQLDASDIELEDGRYFAFHTMELTAGTTYHIDVASGGFDTQAYLFDADNNQLDTNDDGPQMGTNSRITFTPDATGEYSVGISSVNAGKTGAYRLTVTPEGAAGPERREVDGPDTPTQEHVVLLNQEGQADAESTYYSNDFRLEAGQRVVIETYGLSQGCDTVMQLRKSTDPERASADDPVLAENDDDNGLLSSRIVFTAQEAGDYYLAVGVYEGSAGSFSVVVREALPAAEPIVAEGVEIAKDDLVLLGDFEFEAGLQTIRIETADLTPGMDTVIELRKTVDPERASEDDPVLATNDDFFRDDLRSVIYFRCEEAGLYYVVVRNIGKQDGTCTFSITFEE